MYYVIARTAYFNETGEKKTGAYETRYLSVFDLWEADKKQARHFSRFPTATIKKLKTQGVEETELDVKEEYGEGEEEFTSESANSPVISVIQTPSMVLKVKPPVAVGAAAAIGNGENGESTPSFAPTSSRPVISPRPVLRETVLPQMNQQTSTPSGPWRGYVHLARAANGTERIQNLKCLDAVSFTYYYPTGQELGQVFVCWYQLKDGRAVPSLEVFAEAWTTLNYMPDVVQALAKVDITSFSATELCDLLEGLNFRDMTT